VDDYVDVPGPILGGLKDRRKRGPYRRAYKPTIIKRKYIPRPVKAKRRIQVRPDIQITPDWTDEQMALELTLRRKYRN